jgi:hypothetical protein
MSLINQLKALDTTRPDLDELVSLSAQAKVLRAEYESENVDVPEWLDNANREIKREIRNRAADSIEKRKKELQNRLDALKTPTERRAELQAELDRLNGQATGASGK